MAAPTPSFWLLAGDAPSGPFPLAALYEKLVAGEIAWDTRACLVGSAEWLPLRSHPGLGLAASGSAVADATEAAVGRAEPPSPLPVAKPAPDDLIAVSETAGRRPWNPLALAWLSLLFTPLWGGAMAALNNRRVGSPRAAWLGPAVAAGCIVADLAAESIWELPYWLDLSGYVAAVFVLWAAVLRPQYEAYGRLDPSRLRAAGGGRLGLPCLLGAPLALLAIVAFAVLPLIPDEPRRVCEKFARAKSPEEAQRYATLNLKPAVEEMFRGPQDATEPLFELTDEGPAPAEVGGYLVGYRMTQREAAGLVEMEGYFHLVNWSGRWMVEDFYVSSFNRQRFEPWVSLASNYKLLAAPPPTPPPASPKAQWASKAPQRQPGQASAPPVPWYKSKLYIRGLIGIGMLLLGGLGKWANKK